MISRVLKLNEKPSAKSTDSIKTVIFDGPIGGERLGLVLDALKKVKEQNPGKQIKCLIECPYLENISPSQLA